MNSAGPPVLQKLGPAISNIDRNGYATVSLPSVQTSQQMIHRDILL